MWLDKPSAAGCGDVGDRWQVVGTLPAGPSKPFIFSGLPARTAGNKAFQAFVDSQCQSIELDEGNNQLTKSYTPNRPAQPPNPPKLVTAPPEDAGRPWTVTLRIAGFEDPDSDGHAQTFWQVFGDSGLSNLVKEYHDTDSDKLSQPIEAGVLEGGKSYYWRAKVQDTRGAWSDWSEIGRFSTPADCNNNGVPDARDITDGTSKDCNENDVPDEWEADLDGDGTIDDCDECPQDPLHIFLPCCGRQTGLANTGLFVSLALVGLTSAKIRHRRRNTR